MHAHLEWKDRVTETHHLSLLQTVGERPATSQRRRVGRWSSERWEAAWCSGRESHGSGPSSREQIRNGWWGAHSCRSSIGSDAGLEVNRCMDQEKLPHWILTQDWGSSFESDVGPGVDRHVDWEEFARLADAHGCYQLTDNEGGRGGAQVLHRIWRRTVGRLAHEYRGALLPNPHARPGFLYRIWGKTKGRPRDVVMHSARHQTQAAADEKWYTRKPNTRGREENSEDSDRFRFGLYISSMSNPNHPIYQRLIFIWIISHIKMAQQRPNPAHYTPTDCLD
jgi:hypothetical protein